jgi:hypothetical protein
MRLIGRAFKVSACPDSSCPDMAFEPAKLQSIFSKNELPEECAAKLPGLQEDYESLVQQLLQLPVAVNVDSLVSGS